MRMHREAELGQALDDFDVVARMAWSFAGGADQGEMGPTVPRRELGLRGSGRAQRESVRYEHRRGSEVRAVQTLEVGSDRPAHEQLAVALLERPALEGQPFRRTAGRSI